MNASGSYLSKFSIYFLNLSPSRPSGSDLVLGAMPVVRGAANIADQLFGRQPRGWGAGFLAHPHSPWGYDEPEILVTQIANLVS